MQFGFDNKCNLCIQKWGKCECVRGRMELRWAMTKVGLLYGGGPTEITDHLLKSPSGRDFPLFEGIFAH